MGDFKSFKVAVQKQFEQLQKGNLFLVDVDKDELWDHYLNSFPEGTNEIFRERRAYDCVACRQFIRNYGNIVSIKNNNLISIWNVEVEGYFKDVAINMDLFVSFKAIKDKFISDIPKLGIDYNHQQTEDGKILRWDHFYHEISNEHLNITTNSIEKIQGEWRDIKNVFKRSLLTISKDAVSTVLELIDQKSIYRGEEFKELIKKFGSIKEEFDKTDPMLQDYFCWDHFLDNIPVSKIRNSAIGTLLVDISEGRDLDIAVSAYEKIMAPSNYKRPQAIITKKMIEEAQAKIEELGFTGSLGRRYAVPDDITINNVLFANRDVKKVMNVFEELSHETVLSPKKFSKVEQVSIDVFINDILPNISSIELMFENRHENNLMSLIAPVNEGSKTMFKWGNNFSWAYNGDIADSMKQRVKSMGGNVDGVLRFSIQWNDGDNNQNDFDAHCIEPNGFHIYYPEKGRVQASSGKLDVDIRVPGSEVAVENITWTDIYKMHEGRYRFFVHNFAHRGGTTGFTAELEYDGQIYSFAYGKELKYDETVDVVTIEFSRKDGIKFISSLDSTASTRKVWGLNTNQFHKVSMLLNSPNHWDGNATGNKHYFFIVSDCLNDGTPRGFFNEYLQDGLLKYKRVFEALGSKMRVENSSHQLSGIGFSSTQRNNIIAKVSGNFTRTININF